MGIITPQAVLLVVLVVLEAAVVEPMVQVAQGIHQHNLLPKETMAVMVAQVLLMLQVGVVEEPVLLVEMQLGLMLVMAVTALLQQ